MSHSIIPLTSSFYTNMTSFLSAHQPWFILAQDALSVYGLQNNQHNWYGEFKEGKLVGLFYQYKHHLHFCYPTPPGEESPLYAHIERFPYFITHGKKEIVDTIVKRIPTHHVGYREDSQFVEQTSKTEVIKKIPFHLPDLLKIMPANRVDFHALLYFFQEAEIDIQVEEDLLWELLHLGRVRVAKEAGRLVGTIMILKETEQYLLIGNLYVKKEKRLNKVATLLGQHLLLEALSKEKKVCFYYSNPSLKDFYNKGFFQPIGQWVSYTMMKNR